MLRLATSPSAIRLSQGRRGNFRESEWDLSGGPGRTSEGGAP